MSGRAGWVPGLLVALLLAVPASAAAELGVLSAQAAYFQAGDVAGAASAAWMQHDLSPVGPLTVQIQAAAVTGEVFEQRQLVFPILYPTGYRPTIPLHTDPDRIPVEGDGASLDLLAADPAFILSLYTDAPGDDTGFTFGGGLGTFAVSSVTDAVLSNNGIKPDSDAGSSQEEGFFRQVPLDGSNLLAEAEGVGARLVLTGDLSLEFQGLGFEMTAGNGTRTRVEGRSTYEPVAQDLPASDAAEVQVRRFVRLHLTDAVVLIDSPRFDGALQWAGSGLDVDPKGSATFLDATGKVRSVEGERELDNERFQVEGLPRIALAPENDRLDVRLEGPEGAFDATGTFVRARGPAVPGWLVLAGSAGVLALLLSIVVLRRRDLTLSDVESAIESGRYGHAARLAARLMRRHPDEEGALVARAVALSRAGRHSMVIEEVESRLAQKEPADGILHFVLGLAYLERGQRDEGLIKLEEAVRRTPELEPDVDALLPRPRRTPSGYA